MFTYKVLTPLAVFSSTYLQDPSIQPFHYPALRFSYLLSVFHAIRHGIRLLTILPRNATFH